MTVMTMHDFPLNPSDADTSYMANPLWASRAYELADFVDAAANSAARRAVRMGYERNDIVNDLWVRIGQNLSLFIMHLDMPNGDHYIASALRKTADRLLTDEYKKFNRFHETYDRPAIERLLKAYVKGFGRSASDLEDLVSTTSGQSDATEEHGDLVRGLAKLSSEQRALIIMRAHDHNPWADIANELGVDAVRLRKRHSTAMRVLQNQMNGLDVEDEPRYEFPVVITQIVA